VRATIMYKAGDVRVENVPDAKLVEQTDAVIRVTSACICGSDLWPYKELEPVPGGRPMGLKQSASWKPSAPMFTESSAVTW
jgi:threonine dehydrogenase-like Zn-dependent dehydrogenase